MSEDDHTFDAENYTNSNDWLNPPVLSDPNFELSARLQALENAMLERMELSDATRNWAPPGYVPIYDYHLPTNNSDPDPTIKMELNRKWKYHLKEWYPNLEVRLTCQTCLYREEGCRDLRSPPPHAAGHVCSHWKPNRDLLDRVSGANND